MFLTSRRLSLEGSSGLLPCSSLIQLVKTIWKNTASQLPWSIHLPSGWTNLWKKLAI